MSYTLNEAMFSKDQLQFYSSQNLSVIAVSTSGYDLEGQFPGDTRLKMIQDKSLQVKALNDWTYEGNSKSGKVLYIDYSKSASADLASQLFNDFKSNYSLAKVGVNLGSNEVSMKQCTLESCIFPAF
jgi:subtilisin family serine protease